MGGTILKHRETFFDVLCLSQAGDRGNPSDLSQVEAARAFWDKAGCTNVAFHFLGEKRVSDLTEDLWVFLLEKDFLAKGDHDAIFTSSSSDSHYEHRLVSRLGPSLSRTRKTAVVEYCSPSTLEDWVPNLFIDITSEFDSKLNALKAFEHLNAGKSYFTDETIRNFNRHFRSSKRGLRYVEQFRIVQAYR